ncbi:MAG: dihydropteroate synthase [Firmicutes bacterium]|nr:dihydropteroate synthase [Bacillota bacterium]
MGQKTYVLGILNVTPDSFSDGSVQNIDPHYQVEKAARLLEEGADGLDLGAESTRPGHQAVSPEDEWERLGPVLRAVRKAFPTVPLSVDTQKAAIAYRALAEGADIINDIWGLSREPAMARAIMDHGAGCILMYNVEGNPAEPVSVAELRAFFTRQLEETSIPPETVLIDPGIGFRVQGDSSWQALTHSHELSNLGAGILIGHSRKRFLGAAAGVVNPGERDLATAVLSALLAVDGVDVLRVHNPDATRQAVAVAQQWRRFHGTH